ncbi:MAG: hypothetical protein QM758_10005 [Armatimonas sp.]
MSLLSSQRQTLLTRVRRSDATDRDHVAYASLLLRMGDTNEALSQYEQAYLKNPKNNDVKTALHYMYKRMNLPDRIDQQGVPGK